MVNLVASIVLVLAALSESPEPLEPDAGEVRSALAGKGFPWYDAQGDAARPVWPTASEEDKAPTWETGGQAGQTAVFLLMALGLVGLLAGLAWSLWIGKANWSRGQPRKPPPGVGRLAERSHLTLPEGLTQDPHDDPWTQAQRLRQSGDLAGASVALFVHLIEELDRRGLCRSSAGQTARQVIRSVSDRTIRRQVEPTLRLFESVYYGHQAPTIEAFEAAWTDALALRGVWAKEATT